MSTGSENTVTDRTTDRKRPKKAAVFAIVLAALALLAALGFAAWRIRGRMPAEEAAEVTDALTRAYPLTETTLVEGGQPVYDYILLLC